jgi:predicted nucleic acid-binding protein
MSPIRRIPIDPDEKLFYLIDTNFLVNKYLPIKNITDKREKSRVKNSKKYWEIIDKQVGQRKAIIYTPDICIAEAFKVLAKKYYIDGNYKSSYFYKQARDKLSRDIHISPKTLKSSRRFIPFHDISTSRDVIIAVDRFFEIFLKKGLDVTIPDLILLATAKYIIDFYNIPENKLYIITMDNNLWKGSKLISDIPSAYNPNAANECAKNIFE